MIKRTGFVSIAVVAALAAATGTASAKSFSGTVVHQSKHAHSFVIAAKGGKLTAVHARKAIKVGRVVRVSARALRNGTFSLQRAKVLGRARHARLRGTVTYVNRRTGAFVLSSRGASILVRRHKARGARAADSTTPSVGDTVTVDATLDDQGDVEEDSVTKDGVDTGGMDIHGSVLAVDTTARTLSISADDDDESGAALTVHVPDTAAFDITKFAVGQEVELVVTPNTDGSFTLVGTSGDDSSSDGADDGSDDQGTTHDGAKHESSNPGEHSKGSHGSD
jgi:hypothetical protein